MGLYTGLLVLNTFVAALCAGFTLAQAPRQRATQLAAALAGSASWSAFCEFNWNTAQEAATALAWMRMSTPGWAFLGGLAPHLMARYMDIYPAPDLMRIQRHLLRTAAVGYAMGFAVLPLGAFGHSVFGELARVPWGWTYHPGMTLQLFLAAAGVPLTLTVFAMVRNLASRSRSRRACTAS